MWKFLIFFLTIFNHKSLEKFNPAPYNRTFKENNENLFKKSFEFFSYLMEQYIKMKPEIFLYNAGINYFNKINEKFVYEWYNLLPQYCEDIIKSKKYKFEIESFEEFEQFVVETMKRNISKILDEEIKESINNDIINYISENVAKENINKINKFNVLALDESQIGKTTLIANLFKLKNITNDTIGGNGTSTTMKDTLYSSETLKHLQIIDTRGIQRTEFNFDDWLKKYKSKMENNTKSGNFNELIHCIWYCVSGNLIIDDEIEKIKKLNDLSHGYKIPIIYVYLKPFNPHDIKIRKI